jgi:hypothetical protein
MVALVIRRIGGRSARESLPGVSGSQVGAPCLDNCATSLKTRLRGIKRCTIASGRDEPLKYKELSHDNAAGIQV